MPAISETLKLVDQFSATYQSFLSYTERSATAAESLDKKLDSLMSQSGTQLVSAAQRTNALLEEQLQTVKQITSSQNSQTNAVNRTQSAASSLLSTVGRIAALFGGAQILGAAVQYSDSMATATARLNLMNDGLQTTAQLQEMIYQSAQRSRASYLDTVDIVARLGQNAREAFSSNQETIQFAETLSKMFKIAGSSQEEMASASLQLTQALSSGVLRGEELNAVFEAAPNIIRQISEYMGVPIGQIRDMASEGQISAEVVKNALLSAADDVNREFESIPRTFSDAWTEIGNDALMAFQPFFDSLNDFANSSEFDAFLEGIRVALSAAASAASWLLARLEDMIGWIQDNSDTVSVLATAFLGLQAALLAAAAAQAVFNIVASANPISLVIILVFALISAVMLLWDNWEGYRSAMINSTLSAAKTLISIYNSVVVPIYNGSISILQTVTSKVSDFLNFVVNGFYNMTISVLQNLQSLVNGLSGFANAYNSVAGPLGIPEINLDNTRSQLSGAINAMENERRLITQSVSGFSDKVSQIAMLNPWDMENIEQASDYLYKKADEFRFGQIFSNLFGQFTGDVGSAAEDIGDVLSQYAGISPSTLQIGSGLGGLDVGSVGTVDNVKNVDGEVSLSDESLEIYRDLAQRRYMAQVELQTLAPEITVNLPAGAKNITAQDVADKLKAMLIQQMSSHTATAH